MTRRKFFHLCAVFAAASLAALIPKPEPVITSGYLKTVTESNFLLKGEFGQYTGFRLIPHGGRTIGAIKD